MKNKLFTLFITLTLIFSNCMVTLAAEPLSEPLEMADVIPTAAGEQALSAINDSNSIVLDIRAASDYNQAHIKGSISNPVCKSDFSVTTDERDAFINYAKNNISTDKKIYLVCYVGTFCVNHAAKWLIDSGYSASNLYRVTGGVWNDANLSAACNSTAYSYALNDNNGIILDIRATSEYRTGFIDKSFHQPLSDATGVTNGSDDLAKNFTAYVKAFKAQLADKKIYLLCNSDTLDAKAATALLAAEGFKTTSSSSGCSVFTIEDGAASDIKNKFVTNNAVTGAQAVASLGKNSVVILDVRAASVHAAGHLFNSVSIPLFDTNSATNGHDTLAVNFVKTIAKKSEQLAGKDIYLLCNSGLVGAPAATKLLMQAGYSNKDIYTITNGARGAEVKAALITEPTTPAYNFVTGSQAVIAANDDTAHIIDVRSETSFDNGYLANSINYPLFDANGVTTGSDELASAFAKSVNNDTSLHDGKDIYILCNSGANGAQAARSLLLAAGFDNDQIFTITDGAKDANVKASFVIDYNFVTDVQAIAASKENSAHIIDVRSETTFEAGHLDTSLNYPLFNANGVTNGSDTLAINFTHSVNDNAALKDGKDIYILCNSGARGAQNATKLLIASGFNNSNIYTITDGAKSPLIQEHFITDDTDIDSPDIPTKPDISDEPDTNTNTDASVKTGDSANTVFYLLVMIISLSVILTVGKRKLEK